MKKLTDILQEIQIKYIPSKIPFELFKQMLINELSEYIDRDEIIQDLKAAKDESHIVQLLDNHGFDYRDIIHLLFTVLIK